MNFVNLNAPDEIPRSSGQNVKTLSLIESNIILERYRLFYIFIKIIIESINLSQELLYCIIMFQDQV